MKPVIECIRDFVMTFPELKDGCFMIDYLSKDPVEYVVEAVPCDRIFKKYTDGGCIKQFLFIFASREAYSADVNKQIENSAFYEHFENWILAAAPEMLSQFLDGRNPFRLDVLTSGYLFDADYNTARYQIQLRLLYTD